MWVTCILCGFYLLRIVNIRHRFLYSLLLCLTQMCPYHRVCNHLADATAVTSKAKSNQKQKVIRTSNMNIGNHSAFEALMLNVLASSVAVAYTTLMKGHSCKMCLVRIGNSGFGYFWRCCTMCSTAICVVISKGSSVL